MTQERLVPRKTICLLISAFKYVFLFALLKCFQ